MQKKELLKILEQLPDNAEINFSNDPEGNVIYGDIECGEDIEATQITDKPTFVFYPHNESIIYE